MNFHRPGRQTRQNFLATLFANGDNVPDGTVHPSKTWDNRVPQGSFLGSAFIFPSIVSSGCLTSTNDLRNYVQPLFSLLIPRAMFYPENIWSYQQTSQIQRQGHGPSLVSPHQPIPSLVSAALCFSLDTLVLQNSFRPLLAALPLHPLQLCCSCLRSGLLQLLLDRPMDDHLASKKSSNSHPGTESTLSTQNIFSGS